MAECEAHLEGDGGSEDHERVERMKQLVSLDSEQQMQKTFDLQWIKIVVSLALESRLDDEKQIASKNSAI